MPRRSPLHPDVKLLAEVVPPPEDWPARLTAAQWKRVERELGLTLPADYKGLMARYGAGRFGRFLTPLRPLDRNPHVDLVRAGNSWLEAERRSGLWRDKGVPFGLRPDPEGLLPWARTDNGDRLFWYTYGEADRWPVVVWESRSFRFELFQRTAAGFLRLWLAGRLEVAAFPRGPFEPVFEPNLQSGGP